MGAAPAWPQPAHSSRPCGISRRRVRSDRCRGRGWACSWSPPPPYPPPRPSAPSRVPPPRRTPPLPQSQTQSQSVTSHHSHHSHSQSQSQLQLQSQSQPGRPDGVQRQSTVALLLRIRTHPSGLGNSAA
eukprot:2708395-Pyramimonas_sp.AAC.2